MAYPKKMINSEGATALAKQAVHEKELTAKGFYPAPDEPAPDLAPAEPVPCPKCAELMAKLESSHALAEDLQKANEALSIQLREAQKPQTGKAPPRRGPGRPKVEA